jgi:hypothetical protein
MYQPPPGAICDRMKKALWDQVAAFLIPSTLYQCDRSGSLMECALTVHQEHPIC